MNHFDFNYREVTAFQSKIPSPSTLLMTINSYEKRGTICLNLKTEKLSVTNVTEIHCREVDLFKNID